MSDRKGSAARARSARARGRAEQAPAAPPPPPARAVPLPPEPPPAPREGEYFVQLPTFEGPLDLLLHLIQKHELDILDIPVSFITEKYLEYLQVMKTLSIDLASEYLVMAATLTHIKSKMLLPVVPSGQDDDGMPGEDDEDPRAELVRRLLEYQKYKAAAEGLADRGTLGRDVFARGMTEDEIPRGPAPFAPLNVFGLLEAFEKILKRTNVRVDHEVVFDRISITDRIVELTERLSERRAMTFEDLLLSGIPRGAPIPRFELVITFLAVLEMCKLRLIRIHQTDPLAMIHVELAVQDGAPQDAPMDAEMIPEAEVVTEAVPEAEAEAVPEAEAEAVPEAEAEAVPEAEAEAVPEAEAEAVPNAEAVPDEVIPVEERVDEVTDGDG
ncbi:MAG TPA: segregation/condensation protein A [Candidatus Nanopelagicales bacterium]|nr:segregation/condensation protein A [Candidatus Nanopelagicales bacterium]